MMSREEADRENLLADATAYVQRIQFEFLGQATPVFVGFRANDAASFYFGADPVFHFNARRELRRAYIDGDLFKAESGRLVRLRREREAIATALLRAELTEEEANLLLEAAALRLQALHAALAAGKLTIAGQSPSDLPIAAKVQQWLAEQSQWQIAHSARVGD